MSGFSRFSLHLFDNIRVKRRRGDAAGTNNCLNSASFSVFVGFKRKMAKFVFGAIAFMTVFGLGSSAADCPIGVQQAIFGDKKHSINVALNRSCPHFYEFHANEDATSFAVSLLHFDSLQIFQ